MKEPTSLKTALAKPVAHEPTQRPADFRTKKARLIIDQSGLFLLAGESFA
jgi:hypothetical protein